MWLWSITQLSNGQICCTYFEHCCSLSLCHLGSEMIITDIQISIQRSSSGQLTTSSLLLQLNGQLATHRRQPLAFHLRRPSSHSRHTWGQKRISLYLHSSTNLTFFSSIASSRSMLSLCALIVWEKKQKVLSLIPASLGTWPTNSFLSEL